MAESVCFAGLWLLINHEVERPSKAGTRPTPLVWHAPARSKIGPRADTAAQLEYLIIVLNLHAGKFTAGPSYQWAELLGHPSWGHGG